MSYAKFCEKIASSLCKQHQAPCFSRATRFRIPLFHTLFNKTVENFWRANRSGIALIISERGVRLAVRGTSRGILTDGRKTIQRICDLAPAVEQPRRAPVALRAERPGARSSSVSRSADCGPDVGRIGRLAHARRRSGRRHHRAAAQLLHFFCVFKRRHARVPGGKDCQLAGSRRSGAGADRRRSEKSGSGLRH